MTAPVVQQQDSHSRRYVVGFVMPADLSAEDLPDPVDSDVHTRRVPTETAAALRFSGRWSRSSYERRTEQLYAALGGAALEVVGAPRYARFDPPWRPWFLRRNEVVVPVAPGPGRDPGMAEHDRMRPGSAAGEGSVRRRTVVQTGPGRAAPQGALSPRVGRS